MQLNIFPSWDTAPMKQKIPGELKEYDLNQHKPDKPQFAMYELGQYLVQHGSKAAMPHTHSYYQIIWFKEGSGTHYVDFKEYAVLPNSIFFIAKNQVHYFDNNSSYSGVLIHFNESFIVQTNTDIELFLKHNLFSNPYQQPNCCIGTGIESLLEEYLQLIRHEIENQGRFGQEELLRSYLKAFLIQIQRRKNELDGSDKHHTNQVDEKRLQFMRFVNLLDENYKNGLSVSEYAAHLNVSTRTLSDLTSQMVNKSPSQMIQERIILEAQRLLLHSELNISQIGYRLGFDDPSYFVKYFKKHTRVSPSEFRKMISSQ